MRCLRLLQTKFGACQRLLLGLALQWFWKQIWNLLFKKTKQQQQHHFLFSKQNVYFDVHTALIPIPFSTQMKDLKNNDFLILYSNKNIWNHVCPVCLSTSTGWAYGYVIYDQLGSDTSKLRCSWYLNRKSPNLGWCFKFFIIQCHKPPLWKTQ